MWKTPHACPSHNFVLSFLLYIKLLDKLLAFITGVKIVFQPVQDDKTCINRFFAHSIIKMKSTPSALLSKEET